MGKSWRGLSFILVIIEEKESWGRGVELRAIKRPTFFIPSASGPCLPVPTECVDLWLTPRMCVYLYDKMCPSCDRTSAFVSLTLWEYVHV